MKRCERMPRAETRTPVTWIVVVGLARALREMARALRPRQWSARADARTDRSYYFALRHRAETDARSLEPLGDLGILESVTPMHLIRPLHGWITIQVTCSTCRRRVEERVGSAGMMLRRRLGKAAGLVAGLLAGVGFFRIAAGNDLGQCLLVCGELAWIWALSLAFPEDAATVSDPLGQHVLERAG